MVRIAIATITPSTRSVTLEAIAITSWNIMASSPVVMELFEFLRLSGGIVDMLEVLDDALVLEVLDDAPVFVMEVVEAVKELVMGTSKSELEQRCNPIKCNKSSHVTLYTWIETISNPDV